jgi:hypothetical protein
MDFSQFPEWATSDEARVWYLGFALAAMVRIAKAGLRWFKRVNASESSGG